MLYLFIDIDGVFIREDQPGATMSINTDENDIPIFEPACIQPFVRVMNTYAQIKIVISSSWKESFDFETIKSRFPDTIKDRIEGMTPNIWYFITETVLPKYVRHQEVLEYLRRANAEDAYWIAIDDLPEHYPAYVAIVATNPYVGFDEMSAMQLISLIKNTRKPVGAINAA